MTTIQQANALKAVRTRSDNQIAQGGSGFITTDVLRFDVGLSTRALRRVLDGAVSAGALERREAGRGYSYRPVMLS